MAGREVVVGEGGKKRSRASVVRLLSFTWDCITAAGWSGLAGWVGVLAFYWVLSYWLWHSSSMAVCSLLIAVSLEL